MSQGRLYLNLGNSSVQWGWWEGEEWTATGRIKAEEPKTVAEEMREALRLALPTRARPQSVAGCASRGEVGSWRVAFERAFGQPLLLLGTDFRVELATCYRHPEQLGADRVANVLAARQAGLPPCLVLDAGTCLTADVVDASGRHLGGVIAAGLPALKAGILERAPHLGLFLSGLAEAPQVWGRDTAENLSLGLSLGLLGTARALVERYREMTEGVGRVILTGGDADRLAEGLRGAGEVLPLLTLEGVRLAYEKSLVR